MSVESPKQPRLQSPSELRLRAEKQLFRRNKFSKSLRKLGGLTKHQRGLVTALVEDFWRQNSSDSLDASHNNDEGGTIHNGDTPRLTSTNSPTAPKLGKRCQTRNLASSDSSETDSSSTVSVRSVPNVATANKFDVLEVSCTESDPGTDSDDVSIETSVAVDSRISELEQIVNDKTDKIKDLELILSERNTQISSLNGQLTEKDNLIRTLKSNVIQLENKINAHSRELCDTERLFKNHKKTLKKDIVSAFLPTINTLVKCRVEEKLSHKSILSSILSDPTDEEEVKYKTRVEFLSNDPVAILKNYYLKNELVPISSIRRLNEIKDFDYEAYLNEVLEDCLYRYSGYKQHKDNNE